MHKRIMALTRSFIRLSPQSNILLPYLRPMVMIFSAPRPTLHRTIHDDKNLKTENGSKEYQDSIGKTEASNVENKQETTLTQAQRLRKVFADYGSIAVAFHVSISLTSLGICYAAVSSGLDVPAMLQKIGLSQGLTDSALTTGASTFVIAYACHKVFVPVRMLLTITCTPLIVHRLRTMGILKAPIRP